MIYSGGIILASQSPRRKQLLEWAEVPFEVLVQETDESYPPNLTPGEIAIHIAKNKALAIKNSTKISIPILAADTIVVLQNEIINKPKNREDAIGILTKLSGKKHQVITGVVILHNEKEIAFADVTEVEFHTLTTSQLAFYVDKSSQRFVVEVKDTNTGESIVKFPGEAVLNIAESIESLKGVLFDKTM